MQMTTMPSRGGEHFGTGLHQTPETRYANVSAPNSAKLQRTPVGSEGSSLPPFPEEARRFSYRSVKFEESRNVKRRVKSHSHFYRQ